MTLSMTHFVCFCKVVVDPFQPPSAFSKPGMIGWQIFATMNALDRYGWRIKHSEVGFHVVDNVGHKVSVNSTVPVCVVSGLIDIIVPLDGMTAEVLEHMRIYDPRYFAKFTFMLLLDCPSGMNDWFDVSDRCFQGESDGYRQMAIKAASYDSILKAHNKCDECDENFLKDGKGVSEGAIGWDSEFREYLWKKYERASQKYNCCYLRIHKNPSEINNISIPPSFINHFGVDIGGVERPVWTGDDLNSDESLEDENDSSNEENEAVTNYFDLCGSGSDNPQDGDSASDDGNDVENDDDDDGASVGSRFIRPLDDLNQLRRERGENDPHAEYWVLPVVNP